MKPGTPAQALISYARADGEPLARGLHERLTANGISVWFDRSNLQGGRDWWLQICAAIDQVRFLIWIMTPAALQSEVVRREWRYARSQGVTVLPVAASPGLDIQALPRWMSTLHFHDLAHEWEQFLDTLRSEPQRTRVPFMAAPLPASFVSRDILHADLVAALLDQSRGEPRAAVVALLGPGGFGKTTLATALCHDERIQEAFDDGILWVQFGERPGDLVGRLQDVVETISGVRPAFTSLEAAVSRYREVLVDRDVLVVLDDVWNAAHVEPFLTGGHLCARLLTTRNLDTLPPGAVIVDAGTMAPTEARQLLLGGLDPSPAPEMAATARLVQLLGGWPLLLRLVNAALRERCLRHRQGLDEAMGFVLLALDRRGVTAFDSRTPRAREQAVDRTLAVSLNLLTAQEQARYFELGVFADGDIPLAAVGRLWAGRAGLDRFDGDELLVRLAGLSLIQADLDRGVVRLHDVLRDYLVRRIDEPLQELHGVLVDSYSLSTAGNWPSGPDDGYFFQRLGFHLAAAGRREDLYRLLTDDPEWMLAVHGVTRGDSVFSGDLALCIALFGADRSARSLARLAALHTASQVLRHRTLRYSDDDLQVLTCLGRQDEALECARLREVPAEAAEGMIAVATARGDADQVDLLVLAQASMLADSSAMDRMRAEALSALCQAYASARQPELALRTARRIPIAGERMMALARAAAFLPGAEAASVVAEIEPLIATAFNEVAAESLEELASLMAGCGQVRASMQAWGGLAPGTRARILPALLRSLASACPVAAFVLALATCVDAAVALPHAEERAAALSGMCEVLVDIGDLGALTRVKERAKQAAREIATLDYGEAMGAYASLVTVLLPQDGFLADAAEALRRVGRIEQQTGCDEAAQATLGEAYSLLQDVSRGLRCEQVLAHFELPPAAPEQHERPIPTDPDPLELARQGRLAEATEALERRVELREQTKALRESAAAALAASCTQNGLSELAHDIVDHIDDTSARFSACVACLVAANARADPDDEARFMDRLEAIAMVLAPFARAQLLEVAVPVLVRAGCHVGAAYCVHAIAECADEGNADMRLEKLVGCCLAAGLPGMAETIASRIASPDCAGHAYARLRTHHNLQTLLETRVSDAVASGLLDEATELARAAATPYEREKAYVSLGIALARHGHQDRAEQVVLAVQTEASTYSNPQRDIQVEIAASHARAGRFDEAISSMERIDFAWDRARALALIVEHMTEPEHATRAEQLLTRAEPWVPGAGEYSSLRWRIDLLADLALAAGKAGLPVATLRLAGELHRHEAVKTPDKWNLAGTILQGDERERAERACAARIAALSALTESMLARFSATELREVVAAFEDEAAVVTARRAASLRLARLGHLDQAMTALGPQALDDWIASLSTLMSAFDTLESGVGRTTLADAVRIVGWVRRDWRPMAEDLGAPATSTRLATGPRVRA
jgi:tetratricopeptide (TPR) repeat protein